MRSKYQILRQATYYLVCFFSLFLTIKSPNVTTWRRPLMVRGLLTPDDLIATKNGRWHMSLVQFRGQNRGRCYSNLHDFILLSSEWWNGKGAFQIVPIALKKKLKILWRCNSYDFNWRRLNVARSQTFKSIHTFPTIHPLLTMRSPK